MEKRFIHIAVLSLFLIAFVIGGVFWFSQSSRIVIGQERFSGRVAGVSEEKVTPSVVEQRNLSSEFKPLKKDGIGLFAVPTAHSAVLLDAATGIPLFEQDADAHRAIASITKLMTTMIAVETAKSLDEPVTIPEDAVYAEGTRVGCPRSGFCNGERLHVGEQIAVRDLLKAALMNSANDAAISLAEHVSGSQDAFAETMNRRAAELGLVNTHFCTPSGLELDDPAKKSDAAAEVGDLLFAVVNLARHLKADPENILRDTNGKFERRFASIERALAARGKAPKDASLAEMDALWDEAKAAEKP